MSGNACGNAGSSALAASFLSLIALSSAAGRLPRVKVSCAQFFATHLHFVCM